MKVKISLVVLLTTLVAASGAFATGFNLISQPLVPSNDTVSCVMGDSICTGSQITGGNNSAAADEVKYFDAATETFTNAWYKTGGPGPDFLWRGTLTNMPPDRAYWVFIKTGNPAVVLTMTGAVSTTARVIPITPGDNVSDKFNYVGTTFPIPAYLGGYDTGTGSAGDCAGLLASGFVGGNNLAASDALRHYDGTTWYAAFYKTGGPGPDFEWRGTLSGTQAANQPCLVPGDGYLLQVKKTNTTFTSWTYPVPQDTCICSTPKGRFVDSGKAKTSVKRATTMKHRALAPSTNTSLAAPDKAVEERKTR
jgi:hypothetical protein